MEKEQNGFSLLEASFEEIGNSDLTFKNTNIPWYTDIEDAGVNPSLGGDIHSDDLLANQFANGLSEGFLSSIKSNPMGISSVPDNVNFLDSSVKNLDKYGDTLFNLCSGNVEEERFDERFIFQSAFLDDSKNSECPFFDANTFHPKEEGLAFNSELAELNGILAMDLNGFEVGYFNANCFDGDQLMGEEFGFEYGIDQKETGIGNIGEFISENRILNTESILDHKKFDVDIEIVQSNLGIENEYSFDAFHSYNNVNGFSVDADVNIFPNLISDLIEEESFKKNRNLDLCFSAFEVDPKHGLISEGFDYDREFVEELSKIDEGLVKIYRGALEINSIKTSDYKRHVANGFRELISNIIRILAPQDDVLKKWLLKNNRKQLLYEKNGELLPIRKAKFIYIFRNRPKRERKLVEDEVKCLNRLYNILNGQTHSLNTNISDKLLYNYIEKVKNSLKTLVLLLNN